MCLLSHVGTQRATGEPSPTYTSTRSRGPPNSEAVFDHAPRPSRYENGPSRNDPVIRYPSNEPDSPTSSAAVGGYLHSGDQPESDMEYEPSYKDPRRQGNGHHPDDSPDPADSVSMHAKRRKLDAEGSFVNNVDIDVAPPTSGVHRNRRIDPEIHRRKIEEEHRLQYIAQSPIVEPRSKQSRRRAPHSGGESESSKYSDTTGVTPHAQLSQPQPPRRRARRESDGPQYAPYIDPASDEWRYQQHMQQPPQTHQAPVPHMHARPHSPIEYDSYPPQSHSASNSVDDGRANSNWRRGRPPGTTGSSQGLRHSWHRRRNQSTDNSMGDDQDSQNGPILLPPPTMTVPNARGRPSRQTMMDNVGHQNPGQSRPLPDLSQLPNASQGLGLSSPARAVTPAKRRAPPTPGEEFAEASGRPGTTPNGHVAPQLHRRPDNTTFERSLPPPSIHWAAAQRYAQENGGHPDEAIVPKVEYEARPPPPAIRAYEASPLVVSQALAPECSRPASPLTMRVFPHDAVLPRPEAPPTSTDKMVLAHRLESVEEQLVRVWTSIAREDVPRAYKLQTHGFAAKQNVYRRIASACSGSKGAGRAVSSSKRSIEAALRSKRMVKAVVDSWRRAERDDVERKKQVEKDAYVKSKQEEDSREAQRQAKKLEFLLTQTELYSHFVVNKGKSESLACKLNTS